jgi:hypothetical protein
MISRLSRARCDRGVRCIVVFLMVDVDEDVLVYEAGIIVPGDTCGGIMWMLETQKFRLEILADLSSGRLSCEVLV